MGKGMIYRRRKSQRIANDEYLTPYSMVQQLLDREPFDLNGTFLEPCCDANFKTIGNTLLRSGVKPENLTENVFEETGLSFLDWDESKKVEYIITNTPYGNTNTIEFINKARRVATKKIAKLYPISILNGKQRYDLVWNVKEFPLTKLYQFTRFPMLLKEARDDGCYQTGMVLYAWFVFDVEGDGKIELIQVDNSQFCLSNLDSQAS
jgi:hypothetical protein